ncbi:MAG: bifunctional nuclease family protein [Limnochordaceae bacterium]|nr:bifunctional nuclease family protein [Limnochordaceae bacterium]
MLRMKVKVVGIDQRTMQPVVVITDTEEKNYIPIVVGPPEANAINIAMEGIQLPRPITHDLIKAILDRLHAQVERVLIAELKDETYYARIQLRTADGLTEVDARPSDAIAIALRTQAPIYVSEEVAARALVPVESWSAQADDRRKGSDGTDQELEEFRRFLEAVTPEDFRKHLR